MSILLVILGLLLVAALWFILSYNRFITLIHYARKAWADIDVQLKRRYDLIPNLVNTVKGYAAHESGTFEKITEARSKAMGASSLEEKGQAENDLTGALKSLFAVSESYPDLKANQNFLSLQSELADTENKIQASRRFYNGNVRDLNIAIEQFPSKIVSNIFHFQKMDFFELSATDAAARQPVEVTF